MIVRFDSVSAAPRDRRAEGLRAVRAAVAAASFLCCGLAVAQGAASAAPAAAASTAGQYTVHPGQSLHDVAVDLTQSHDKATLARMSQALFDANPDAFMKHDPSRMRVGAALNVPATPDVSSAAEGMTAASGAAAAAAATVASTTAASAPVTAASAAPAASASASAAASSAAAQAVAAASTAAAAATAGANASSAASAAPAAAAAAAASAVPASGPEAPAQAASVAVATGASAASPATSASDAHVWSGAIQAAPAASGASAVAPAQGVAKAPGPVTVSSLQQLLALKNRVLMALQQHGIGKPAQTAGGANGALAGAPAAQGGAPAQTGGATPGAAGGQPELSPIAMGAVGAIVLVLIALFVRLLMRKRGKPAEQAAEAGAGAAMPEPAPVVTAAAPIEELPVLHEPIARAEEPPHVNEAAPAAPVVPAEPAVAAAPEEHEVAVTPVPTPVVSSEPLEPEVRQEPQESHVAQENRASDEAFPHAVEPHEPQTLADATAAASLEAAAELGASALPPESLEAPRAGEDAAALARTLEDPPRVETPAAPEVALDFGGDTPEAPQAEPPFAHLPHETETFQPPAPLVEPEIPAALAVPTEDMNYAEVPTEFPHDAVQALGGIDMPLPPRLGEPVVPVEPLSTEPVATPEASARLASPFQEPPAPFAGEAIEAGTAGAGALAGLAAPRFGALTLDFDLNLPPDSAEPLTVFTPEQLSRIARNKLDLAQEYIALGDVAGARSLINEVIESNDHATRSDAQALLSTLAPLS